MYSCINTFILIYLYSCICQSEWKRSHWLFTILNSKMGTLKLYNSLPLYKMKSIFFIESSGMGYLRGR